MEFDFASHPHRRLNALTNEWILVSPHRARRPWDGQVEKLPHEGRPSYDPHCYLCPGNVRASGEHNPDYRHNFVFTNDFAALIPDTPLEHQNDDDLFVSQPVRGTARVLCFDRDHAKTIPQMEVEDIQKVVELWGSQYEELSREYPYVQIFENKGTVMGCSNPHPHGQIWACSYIPQEIRKELDAQRAYYNKHGSQLLADYVQRELQKDERVICSTGHFAALVPYWAFWPFEALVVPKFKVSAINELSAEQRLDLAVLIKKLTTRYDNLFECSFPYSMGWHNPPGDGDEHPEWMLHAHYYPPLLRSATVKKFVAGFELLAEKQRDLTPEQAAERLKALSEVHYLEKRQDYA